jgi:TPR repeat protein
MRRSNSHLAIDRLLLIAVLLFSSMSVLTAVAQTVDDQGLQSGHSVPDVQRKSFEKTLEKARAGDAQEQFELSRMYRYGIGAESDESEADSWLRKSAETGNVEAQFEMGAVFEGKNDYESAFAWLLKAAQAGTVAAQKEVAALYRLGHGVETDYAQSMQWYLKAAAQHNADAMCDIGYMYEYGKGVPQDYENAMKWYRLASDAGAVLAKENIGKLYFSGHGVPQDYKEAARWFSLSAEQGYPDSEVNLAIIYIDGPPELRNPEKAVQLWESAADQGNSLAGANLAHLYLSGQVPNSKMNTARAIRLLEPLAEKGDAKAQFWMGAAEQKENNYKAAESWYLKAAEQDEGSAIFALADIYNRGQGVARNFSEAAKLYVRANDLLRNATVANDAGWFFATCEDVKFRNRELALKYGLQGVELSEGKNAGYLDTLAEAYFFDGQYEKAASTETRAIELEPKQEEFKKSLARFIAALDASKAKLSRPAASK